MSNCCNLNVSEGSGEDIFLQQLVRLNRQWARSGEREGEENRPLPNCCTTRCQQRDNAAVDIGSLNHWLKIFRKGSTRVRQPSACTFLKGHVLLLCSTTRPSAVWEVAKDAFPCWEYKRRTRLPGDMTIF
ncbi:hypothetical protein Naga_100156g5 [Nannochloropsis gaditana]|uniref:Uncharacterized protein n=1 Tax=Nannochloropsis gaditana TaxID=72520 RepID=W7T2A5_9STRA|nr:hypothetical protein Naga_100156g5 [Nannochloropsis gaditana]